MKSKRVLDVKHSEQASTDHSPSASSHSSELSAQQVSEYLAQHLDFLRQHPELLSAIELEYNKAGATASLVQKQVSLLREQQAHYQQQLSTLLEQARLNQTLQDATQKLVLALLDINSLADLVEHLNTQLSSYYPQVSQARLIVYSEALKGGDAGIATISEASARAKISGLAQAKTVISGTFRAHELEFIFGAHDNLQSAALTPLNQGQQTLGFLALASTSSEHFKTGSDTYFIDFLTQVLTRCINRLNSACNA